MTVFLIVGALLIAAALLFVLPPLLRRGAATGVSRDAINISVYRDQLRELEADLQAGTMAAGDYERVRREIEKRMLEDVGSGDGPPAATAATPRRARATALIVGLAVPLCALSIYLVVGSPRALTGTPAGDAGADHAASEQRLAAMVDGLAQRLRDNPENTEGWVMLGRSYVVLGRYDDAGAAYAKAVARLPRDAQLLADYADVLGMAQGGRLQGEPAKIIARALAADRANVKALALAGSLAFERKDYAGAVRYWERVLSGDTSDSEFTRSIRAGVEEARSLGAGVVPKSGVAAKAGADKMGADKAGADKAGADIAGGDKQPGGGNATAGKALATSGRVSGVVRLSPELAAKADPADTVFIFARAAQGPRMPLAILRKQVRDLPLEFTLDDSMAMAQEMKLSSFPMVVVGARISKTSDAMPRSGDLQGLSVPVKIGASGLKLSIDTVVP